MLGLAILLGGLVLVIRRAPRLGEEARPRPEGSLTVVVPAYNEEANIAACIGSLLASAPPCPHWQVLLVDDGSPRTARAARRAFALPLDHWWLMGAGGLVVGALAPTSVWRTLSGRGWTWKGRALG
ncbi:MAG: glycosyltransferase family 2 protein [Cyanobium sp.]